MGAKRLRALIARWRAQRRLRRAWTRIRDEFADHRLALTTPYDDQCPVVRWEDVVADLEGELWFDELLASALWRELIDGDDDDLEMA